MTTDDVAMKNVTPEEFAKTHSACVDAVRKEIRAGKGDSEKQKTCPHSDFRGDLLKGPCVCAECGTVIIDA